MGITNTADRFRGLPHYADWRYPHDGRNPDLSDSVEMAESIAPVAPVRALDGPRSAFIADQRDSRFTRTGVCCLFPRRVTFVQFLRRTDV
jgi:hypothetical protein